MKPEHETGNIKACRVRRGEEGFSREGLSVTKTEREGTGGGLLRLPPLSADIYA